jgi:hypothetical protein
MIAAPPLSPSESQPLLEEGLTELLASPAETLVLRDVVEGRFADLGDLWDASRGEVAEADDPFEDFEEDDFDDEFDDDFEEDWEDDLTEDVEFPDTFGGQEEDEEKVAGDEEEESPFSDDPEFDDD